MERNPRNIVLYCLAIAFGVTLVIELLNFVFSGFAISELTDFTSILITFLYASAITFVNFFYFYSLYKKLNWNTQAKKLLVLGITGSVVFSMITFFLCRLVQLVYIEQRFSLSEFLKSEKPETYFFTFLLVVIISLFFHLFYFYKNLQKNKIQEQKIIAGTASAQFDALKNQLDPHFLFNSLNVLTSLIDENPEQAQNFTTSLSKVYRYVLEQKNKDLVSVQEELNFARIYIGLLKMRFENGIQFEIPEQISNPDGKIVPLSLQLLLENAVKHNVISENNPLIIKIYEENGMLVAQNNLQQKNTFERSNGIGLSNITQRYHLLTARKMLLHKDKEIFKVGLPILTKQISIATKEKTTDMENSSYQKMKRAQKEVEKIKGFYGNITAYAIIVPFLTFVNYFSNGFDFLWFLFPAIGWGIGIAFHYMDTFGHNLLLGKNWEKRKIRELMERDEW